MIGDYLDQYTYTYLLEQALARVPDNVDKREGSIIYDALAPACYELAEFYMQLKQVLQQSYALYATGEHLDLRVAEQGMTRIAATYAVMRGVFLDSNGIAVVIPIGTRFQTISDEFSFVYVATAAADDPPDGVYELTCETLGEEGNVYRGNLMPIDYIAGLATAQITHLLEPARNVETDEELRERYFESVRSRPFGGNIAQYRQEVKMMDGVAGVQVYPIWNGGGTVKVVITADDAGSVYQAPSPELIAQVQNALDPEPQGTGLGLAPIGHLVTVTAPTEVPISVTVNVQSDQMGVATQVGKAIEDYFTSVRATWDQSIGQNMYVCAIYWSRLMMAILNVPHVRNVTSLYINGLTTDIYLMQSASLQELPVTGVVSITVSITESPEVVPY